MTAFVGSWTEKYRPQTIADCILPDDIKSTFADFVRSGDFPNMLLSGSAGTGKTTIAKAMCNELGCDFLVINASDENGIDVLRTKIKDFVTTVSFDGKPKVVILDEADYLTPNTMSAMRNFTEAFSNARFILTCNFENRIIEPLRSRMATFHFKTPKEQASKMAAQFFRRLKGILDTEGVQYSDKVVAELVTKYYPDFRKVINELQRYSSNGFIDEGILANVRDVSIRALVDALRDQNFKDMRSWVGQNSDSDFNQIFRSLYDTAHNFVKPQSIPQMVLIIAEYQYKASFVADQEINMVAAMTELMSSVEFING